MAVDGFFIYHLIDELNEKLINKKLEKIYMNDESSFLLQFYKKTFLQININMDKQGIYFVNNFVKTNTNHSQFFVNFKKQFEGARLMKIEQYLNDRVLIFNFERFDSIYGKSNFKFVFEWMGKHANLILIDENNLIIDAYKKMLTSQGRKILPKADFSFFNVNKKSSFIISDINSISSQELVNNYLGISPLLAKYLVSNQISNILSIILKPTIYKNTFYSSDVFENGEKLFFKNISNMLEHYYFSFNKINTKKIDSFIEKQLLKLKKKKSNLLFDLSNAKENLKIKEKADIIYSLNLNLKGYYSYVEEIDLNVDPSKTLNENVQNMYKLYQKAKRSINKINEEILKNDLLIYYFEDLTTYVKISNKDDLTEIENELIPYGFKKRVIKKTKKDEIINFVKIVEDDATYYIGKNNKQNSYLLKNIIHKEDYWFHVNNYPGGHVVVKTNLLTNKIIHKASNFALYFSKLRFSSGEINYTTSKNLKRIPNHPANHVILSKHETISINQDDKLIDDYSKYFEKT